MQFEEYIFCAILVYILSVILLSYKKDFVHTFRLGNTFIKFQRIHGRRLCYPNRLDVPDDLIEIENFTSIE